MNKFLEIVYKILAELSYEAVQALAIEDGINLILFKNNEKKNVSII